jgi:hypothetical protein
MDQHLPVGTPDLAVLPDPPPFVQPICGRRTDARERSDFRFSQELPPDMLFRRRMAPDKGRPSLCMRLVMTTAGVLENTHMNTRMPPSIRISAEVRQRKQRSPHLVHGTLYRPLRFRRATGRPPSDEFFETFHLRDDRQTVRRTRPESAESDDREAQTPDQGRADRDQTQIRALDVARQSPHLTKVPDA